jgi:chromosome segregation ATPase
MDWNLAVGILGFLFGGGVVIELVRMARKSGAAEVERKALEKRLDDLEERLSKVPTQVPSLGDVDRSQAAQRDVMNKQLNDAAVRLHQRIDEAFASLAKVLHDQGVTGSTIASLREDWYNFTTQITSLIRDEAVTAAAVSDLKDRLRTLDGMIQTLSTKLAAVEATNSIKRTH